MPAAGMVCQHPECSRPVYQRGWCSMHYTRAYRSGDPGEGTSRRMAAAGENCSVPGCTNPVIAKGICNTHRMRLRQVGGVDLPARIIQLCTVEGCHRRAKAQGLCGKHYQRLRNRGSPLGARRYGQTSCDLPGCDLPHSWGGCCTVHAMQLWRYGTTGEPRIRRYRPGEQCEVPECRDLPHAQGLCVNHYVILVSQPFRRALKRAASGSASKEAQLARVAYYGFRCYLCGGRWEAIDHVKPLSKGGSGWPSNLRPICQSCNSRKGSRWPFPGLG